MKTKSILLLVIIAFFCTSMMCDCDDDSPNEPQLPPETTIGANTFGCLIDGKVWRNKTSFPYSSLSISQLSEDWLIIIANNYLDDTISTIGLNIRIKSIMEKKYELDTSNCFIVYSKIYEEGNYSCVWSKESSNYVNSTGFIELTRFDIQKGIVSGKFEANLSNSDCGTISITEGRFDLKK